jgi:hypothetical protein
MKIFELIKRLFKRKEKKQVVTTVTIFPPFKPKTPQPHHMSESKLYKQPNHYSKRMWNNKKPLPKNFKDEDEEC